MPTYLHFLILMHLSITRCKNINQFKYCLKAILWNLHIHNYMQLKQLKNILCIT